MLEQKDSPYKPHGSRLFGCWAASHAQLSQHAALVCLLLPEVKAQSSSRERFASDKSRGDGPQHNLPTGTVSPAKIYPNKVIVAY